MECTCGMYCNGVYVSVERCIVARSGGIGKCNDVYGNLSDAGVCDYSDEMLIKCVGT